MLIAVIAGCGAARAPAPAREAIAPVVAAPAPWTLDQLIGASRLPGGGHVVQAWRDGEGDRTRWRFLLELDGAGRDALEAALVAELGAGEISADRPYHQWRGRRRVTMEIPAERDDRLGRSNLWIDPWTLGAPVSVWPEILPEATVALEETPDCAGRLVEVREARFEGDRLVVEGDFEARRPQVMICRLGALGFEIREVGDTGQARPPLVIDLGPVIDEQIRQRGRAEPFTVSVGGVAVRWRP